MEKNTRKEKQILKFYKPSAWVVERFFKVCGGGEITKEYFISKDKVMGIPRTFNKKFYMKLGDFKIVRRPRLSFYCIVFNKNYAVKGEEFFRAMRVLRRRKYITLGVYKVRKELPELLVVSSRGEHIVIAPYTLNTSFNYYPNVRIEDLVDKVPEEFKIWKVMKNLEKS